MKWTSGIVTATAAAFLILAVPSASAIDLQFTQVANRSQVVDIRHAGDGSGRLFLVIRNSGRVYILKDGALQNDPFLNIGDRVRSSGGEQGLLSLAFDPNYATSGLFYLWYTDLSGDTTLSRFSVSANPDLADAGSEEKLLVISQPFSNHNGGRLLFGPDGMLYLSVGDGGSANDPLGNGQALDTLLGKIIRLDVNPAFSPYGIPQDNPFVTNGNALNEIWAYGLRNPWRMSFDRLTGDLYIADVGQSDVEEIDHQPASSTGGENYGWNIMEGGDCFSMAECDQTGLTLPVTQYLHNEGCSVTGGEVYRGATYPDLVGVYLYGDYCSGRIWGLSRNGNDWQSVLLADTTLSILTFGESEDGNIYLSDGNHVYLISDGAVVTEPDFTINAGLNDAWVHADAPFQGFFFTVFPVRKLLFLAMFTFDSVPPGPGVTPAVFGTNDQRWVSGLGAYSGNSVTIDVELTSGGIFNAFDPLATQQPAYGTITIVFNNCNEALLTYDFPSLMLSGQMTLTRAVPDNAVLCETLAAQ